MPEPIRPYEGQQPYLFISYAHADAPAVMAVVRDMYARGYRVWYDEGIEAGSEWPEYIASHLNEAHLVLAFITPAYLASDNCRKEMHFAVTKRKKIINIFLEETRLSPGMEMQIGNLFALMKYTYPSEAYFYEKLYSAELLNSEPFADPNAKRAKRIKPPRRQPKPKKKKWKRWLGWLGALLVVGVIIAALIVGHFTGLTQRFLTDTVPIETLAGDTVCSFQNELLERAAREYAGTASGDVTVDDLKVLTALYLCGDRYWFEAPSSGVSGIRTGSDTAYVNASEPVARGSIRDLSDLAYFPSLTTVWVQFQDLTSLQTLPACGIEVLDVSGNRIAALAGIENLPNLQTLTADGNAVTDLAGLEKCLDLRAVSLNGANASDLSVFRPLRRLQSFAISNATLAELSIPLHQGSITSVALYDCDLRGSFFHSFDRERAIVSLTFEGCQLDSTGGLGDFTGLRALTVRGGSGTALDWSALGELPSLETITATAEWADVMTAAAPQAAVTAAD